MIKEQNGRKDGKEMGETENTEHSQDVEVQNKEDLGSEVKRKIEDELDKEKGRGGRANKERKGNYKGWHGWVGWWGVGGGGGRR